jgi:hypothetical protein
MDISRESLHPNLPCLTDFHRPSAILSILGFYPVNPLGSFLGSFSALKPYVHGAESLVVGGGYVFSGVLLHWLGWFLV